MTMLVASEMPSSWIWHLNFAETHKSHTKGLLLLLYPGLKGIIEVDTDTNLRFVSFNVAHSNDRVLCVYAASGYNTGKQLARERFFKGLQNYKEHKVEGNENKIILEEFDCTMDKEGWWKQNTKTLKILFKNSLSKLIVDNGL